jgi:hypothetical protein
VPDSPEDRYLIQLHYEALRAAQPDLPHRELWRLAREAAFSQDTLAQRAAEVPHAFGVSRRAVIGFGLVCVATGLATITVVWSWNDSSGFGNSDVGLSLWLAAVAVGFVSLGVLLSAIGQIRGLAGHLGGESLVWWGIALAVLGSVEVFITAFPYALT